MGDIMKGLAGPAQMGLGGATTAMGNQAGPMMMANGLNQTMQQMGQPQQPPPQPHPMQPPGNPMTTPMAPSVQTPQAPQVGPAAGANMPPQLLAMLMQRMGQG